MTVGRCRCSIATPARDFHFIDGRNHFDLYQVGGDRNGLRAQIAREMYRVARP